MPLYEFRCEKCGEVFDELLTVRELKEGKRNCPACKSDKVVQLISPGLIRTGHDGYQGKIR